VLLISIWQIVIFIGGYEEALLPSPITVGKGIITLIVTGTIFEHVGMSLMRFFIGYFSAVLPAVIFGLTLDRTKRIWQVPDASGQTASCDHSLGALSRSLARDCKYISYFHHI